MSRQMGKTKLEICAKLGIDGETFDAYIDMINNEDKRKEVDNNINIGGE